MKKMVIKNWMMALLLSGVCCGFVACSSNDDNLPKAAPDITAVQGVYDGEMNPYEVVPNEGEGEGEEPAGTQVDATVSSDAIVFENFPIRDLIIQVLGDEALADAIVEKIGQVDYSVPYTALMNEDKTGVRLSLMPEPLKLTLPNDNEGGETENFEAAESTEIEVSIVAEEEGVYTIESGKLGFRISAASVKIGENELPNFNPFTLDFDMNKK